MILLGDCISRLAEIESESIQCCVTSPPYWGLRDYDVKGQLGLEETPEQYVGNMRMVFEQVRRVLKPDGTLWLNLGNTWRAGFSERIPWRVCDGLVLDGWSLVTEIIWHKSRVMPMGLKKRPLPDHEYIFLFSKSNDYFYDQEAIKVPLKQESLKKYQREFKDFRSGTTKHLRKSGEICPRQGPSRKISAPDKCIKRTVWKVCPDQFKGAHFATFPPDLIEPCILAGSRPGDTVLDPFFGAGTVGLVSMKHERKWIGIELNPEYVEISRKRLGLEEPA